MKKFEDGTICALEDKCTEWNEEGMKYCLSCPFREKKEAKSE